MIVLCGTMASGKTTIGRHLAEALSLSFVDLDQYIEEIVEMDIPTIFETFDEVGFREMETLALQQCLEDEDIGVLSLGGGTIHSEVNWASLMQADIQLIALIATWDEVSKRIEHSDRPLKKRAEDLFHQRQSKLSKVPYQIQVDQKTPAEIVTEIIQKLEADGD